MSVAEEDPNIEFLKELDKQMNDTTFVQHKVHKAMASAHVIMSSDRSEPEKALALIKAVSEISNAIVDHFNN